MTPIIVTTTDGETVTLSLSEVNKIIEQVSKEAFNEGLKAGWCSNFVQYSPVYNPPVYNPPIIHWDMPYKDTVTCTDTTDTIK